MASKQFRGSILVSPQMADDFKLISGIGPALTNRLHDAGIRTFTQLAAHSPARLAASISGLSVKRITRQDWIGQARKLASIKPRPKRHKKETAIPTIRQHYENFTIEFLMDEKKVARRTRVVHVQSGDVDTWAKWDTERLIDFLARHTEARLRYARAVILTNIKPKLTPQPLLLTKQPSEPIAEASRISPVNTSTENLNSRPSLEISGSSPQVTVSAGNLLSGNAPQQLPSPPLSAPSIRKIHLIKWETLLSKTNQTLRNLPHDRPFDVKLTLDLTNASLSDISPIACTASLYAKKLGGGHRQVIGETQSTMPYLNIIDLTIGNATLVQGLYRLDALVRLTSDDATAGLTALLKGDLLQVY
jgi:hypothetical protein